ncbi:hypothetical protein CLHUN_04400 [Ruminiclostridium hungatei]|uniref:TIR domain-containing protein n=1 Tax=Ruminiclostridium hungatei TaxID=48256 RepID=A0A1V4SR95_RUMHU|nr:hypothetical protein [Ruminiclostridium hungatei]OPX45965.1 hypothetical protein CLHUN_04400 [Ruminiclostridium hungatei]
MIPIFLSRPNPFIDIQDLFLKELTEFLLLHGMESITMKAKDYNPYESLTCLNELIKRCYGMVIVAFGQSYVEKGFSKKGAVSNKLFFDSEEKELENLWITSPFCHIEGAIAFSNKLPLLVIEQNNVKIEGILKNGDHAIKCPSLRLIEKKDTYTYFLNKCFIKSFHEWSQKVIDLHGFITRTIC